jgi:cystathionine beta-lyase/cystathionine gamma-synthase
MASHDDRVAFLQNAAGAVPSPMNSFMVMRGTKTLHVRMDRHESNARTIAAWLEQHPQVDKVITRASSRIRSTRSRSSRRAGSAR